MRVLLTSAGLETEEIKECFVDMAGKDRLNIYNPDASGIRLYSRCRLFP